MVKVRFAPSPTGYLHIGGARTALFNWMYARALGGQFVLRIEDTDLVRSKTAFVDEITDSMQWLGFDWDEIYYQSKRFDIYREYAQKLLQEEKAYKDGEAIILHMPQQEIKLYDLIRGEIVFDTQTIKDQVLIKSDGSPTYSFACVVDDALMEITCVIRGEDHISNTPKQMVIYQALGFKVPKFAHLPLIMGEDGTRLSKRTGAVAVSDYRSEGFLPEALVNYLMLLGWSPGNDQEIIAMTSALKKFTVKKINKAAAVFSMDKLRWVNNQYIKQTDVQRLFDLLVPLLKAKGYISEDFNSDHIKNIISLYQSRLSTFSDFIKWTDYIFLDKVNFEEGLKEEYLTPERAEGFRCLSKSLNQLDDFDGESAETAFRKVVEALGLKMSDLVHPVRVALTGRTVGPGLFETMAILGKVKTVNRLTDALSAME